MEVYILIFLFIKSLRTDLQNAKYKMNFVASNSNLVTIFIVIAWRTELNIQIFIILANPIEFSEIFYSSSYLVMKTKYDIKWKIQRENKNEDNLLKNCFSEVKNL